MQNRKENIHRKIYIGGLVLLVLSLPLSVFFISISQFILVGNWIVEGKFKQKFEILKSRKGLIVFLLLFAIHLIWLFNTSDFNYAVKDLRIKLPLLLLPLIIGTSHPVTVKEFKIVLLGLVGSILVASFISTGIYLGFSSASIEDNRQLSPFISHIRFSLVINFCIFVLLGFVFGKKIPVSKNEKFVFIAISLWLFLFLFILKSFTGIAIFFILLFIISAVKIYKIRSFYFKIPLLLALAAIVLVPSIYLKNKVDDFYDFEKFDRLKLESQTKSGNYYYHSDNPKRVENGNYVDVYISWKEIKPAWEALSKIPFDSLDKKSQPLKTTLVRYMTSKGLRKDKEGFEKLTDEDIKKVESGITNYKFQKNPSLDNKIYELIWQFDVYLKEGNPSGHSVIQRLEFLKASFGLIKDNFWLGIGTGDLPVEYKAQYKKMDSQLKEKFRLRAHNQWVSFFVAFGIFGFLIAVFAIFYPIFKEKKHRDYYFLVFGLIAFLSMFNEDTIESQVGVTFFAFLYSFLIFGNDFLKKKLHG
ncbi:MAG: O-antigen ligase family protein [Bacteroidales bacterium]|nr:O-antigen ligase family protein [Bacteroidales bacterium]